MFTKPSFFRNKIDLIFDSVCRSQMNVRGPGFIPKLKQTTNKQTNQAIIVHEYNCHGKKWQRLHTQKQISIRQIRKKKKDANKKEKSSLFSIVNFIHNFNIKMHEHILIFHCINSKDEEKCGLS